MIFGSVTGAGIVLFNRAKEKIMEEYVLKLIKAMEAVKKEKKVEPSHVTGMNLVSVIKVSLTKLAGDGRIHYGTTANDYYVKSIDEPIKEK